MVNKATVQRGLKQCTCTAVPHLTRREAHDGLTVLNHCKDACLHNEERVTWLALRYDLGLLREGHLLKDVAELAALSVAELLQERHPPQRFKAPRVAQLLEVTEKVVEVVTCEAEQLA